MVPFYWPVAYADVGVLTKSKILCMGWCADLDTSDSCRIIRGGGWDNYAKRCLTVNCMGFMPVERDAGVGFRVVEDK